MKAGAEERRQLTHCAEHPSQKNRIINLSVSKWRGSEDRRILGDPGKLKGTNRRAGLQTKPPWVQTDWVRVERSKIKIKKRFFRICFCWESCGKCINKTSKLTPLNCGLQFWGGKQKGKVLTKDKRQLEPWKSELLCRLFEGRFLCTASLSLIDELMSEWVETEQERPPQVSPWESGSSTRCSENRHSSKKVFETVSGGQAESFCLRLMGRPSSCSCPDEKLS